MSTQIRGNKQIKNITIQNEQIANGAIELDKLKEGSELLKRDGSVAATGDFDLGSNQLKNVGAPVDANDAVRKADLDAVIGGSIVTREIPTGSINGSNTQFSLANTPNIGTEQVFLNGSLLNTGGNSDYSIDGDTITFTIAPQTGDTILVNYITDMIVVSLDINTTLTQFNSRLTTSESELFTAQGAIAGAQTNISNLQGRMTTAEADIVALESDVSAAQGNISTLQSNVSTLQSGLSSEITARQNAVSSLNSSVTSLQSADTALGNRMTAAEGDISALESADATFDIRVGVLEDGLQTETNARTSADTALSSRVTALENAPDPVTALSALSDVTISSPTANQILKYNGSGWVNGPAPSTFSGSYTDLTDKPSLFSGSYTDLTNKPSLFSGSYIDLTNKPDLSVYALDSDLSAVDTRVQTLEDNAFVTREVPSGSVNGTNTMFTLANTPVVGSEQVFVNGLLQAPGATEDYTISGDTITFVEAPLATYKIHVSYATGNYAVVPAGLGGSSFSGSYNDLTDKPTLFSGAYVDLTGKPSLFSGSYNDLSDKPSIPSLSGYATESYVNTKVADLVNSAPSTLDTLNELATALGNDANFSTTITNALAAKANTSSLAAVATSGSYADLSNKPSLFSGSYTDLTNKPTLFDGAYASLTGKPSLATVATSGSYNDLSDKPSIPSLSGYATTAYVDSAVAGVSSGGGSGSGDIEVYQDEEFAWSVNHNYNPSLVRTITHSKGRRPDIIKVFVKYNNTWKEEADFYTYVSDTSRGWFDDTTNASNTDPANKTMIALYQHTPQYYGVTSVPCRIRLYWFGNHNLATQSAGAYSVGGGLTGGEYVIPTFSHPQQTGTNKVAYTITHNLNTLTPIVCAQVNATTGDFGASTSGWMNIPTYFPMGNWTEYYGHNVEIVDANTIKLVLFGIGNGSRQVKGIVKK